MNLAASYLKLQKYDDAITQCNKALEKDKSNTKAIFRRASAYAAKNDFDLAEKDFARAVELDPTNKEIQTERAKNKKKIKDQEQQEKKFYSSIFSKMAKENEKLEEEEKKKEEQRKKEETQTAAATETTTKTESENEKNAKEQLERKLANRLDKEDLVQKNIMKGMKRKKKKGKKKQQTQPTFYFYLFDRINCFSCTSSSKGSP